MAQDQTEISVTRAAWTQITNADVTTISFQVLQGEAYIRGTTDTTQPDAADKGWLYKEGEGVLSELMSGLFNLSGADRVWARSKTQSAIVQVDHA